MPIMIENINAQTITPALGKNPRQLYEHQEEAIRKLDAMDKRGIPYPARFAHRRRKNANSRILAASECSRPEQKDSLACTQASAPGAGGRGFRPKRLY